MDTTQILTIVLLISVLVAIVFLFLKINKPKNDNNIDKSFTFLQNQINALTQIQNEKLDRTIKELNDRLREQNTSLNEQMNKSQSSIIQQFAISQKSIKETSDTAAKIVKDVTEKLTKLDETNKQVVSFAEQLQSLENILKNPKQRGILGEYFLETALTNVLPQGSFQMQYKFRDGEIVDAAIFVGDKIIPVDSKFSLENYNRIIAEKDPAEKERLEKLFKTDLKNRIDETSKYIRPEENTMDFAFMFIPSEGIYYDILINQAGSVKIDTEKLIEEAFRKRVLIVSPTNFLAYLQTVLQGLRALKVEESAKNILIQISALKKHLDAFDEQFDKLGKHLGTTVSAYNSGFKNLKSIDKDIFKLTGESLTITAEELDKPLNQ